MKIETLLSKFKDQGKRGWKWVKTHKMRTFLYLVGGAVGMIGLLVLMIYLGVFGRLPSSDFLKHMKNPVASTIYGSNKEVVGHYYIQNRSNIDSSEVNAHIRNALVAVEDIRFYEHHGVDYRSLGRVLVKSVLLSDEGSGGGSTLTQQLAKNIFGRRKTFAIGMFVNKVKEMMIARRMEDIFTKDEILLLYLNTVSFGENLYGLEKVAYRYFNKKPQQLSLDESALLVGLLKAPNAYNPRKNPERAMARRNVVLSQMYKYGKIDEATFLSAKEKKTALNYQQPKNEASYAAYYKEYLRKEFQAWAEKNPKPDGSLYNLNTDGLSIYTSLHPSIQKSAEKAMQRHMERLQAQFDKNWDVTAGEISRDSFLLKVMYQDKYIRELQAQGLSDQQIRQSFDKEGEKRIWDWDGGFQSEMMTFRAYITHELTRLHAGILALDNSSGKIMAYVGGNDYNYSQYDHVQLPRQAGSTFKPIAYLAGLENGLTPCDFFENQRKTYAQYEGWTPRNANGQYGGSYSLWGALANSVNTVSADVILKSGVNRTLQLAKRMGIQSDLPKVPSLVLGTAEVSLLEMVGAYAYIANGGGKVTPFSILKIEDENGNLLYQAKYNVFKKEEVAEPFQQIQQMMRAVITEGTGKGLQNTPIPYNLIGKTGTTQNNSDGWFIGSSPEVTVGAWVGALDKRVHFKSTSLGSGAHTALPMVARTFGDLSLWRKPILSDFAWSIPPFDCVAFSELPAAEAQLLRPLSDSLMTAGDSLLVEEAVSDSLGRDSLP